MRLVAVMLAAGLAAGCGPMPMPVLVADNETPEQRRQNVAECRLDATRAGARVFHPNVFVQASDRSSAESRVYRACMLAKGYREERRVMTFAEWQAYENEGR